MLKNSNKMKNVFLLSIAICISINNFAQTIVKRPIPDKLVVLTFDDAPVSQFMFAAPLLKEYGFGATFYVCEFPPNFKDNTKYMNWSQIQQLGQMGFEVGNHTHTHALVSQLSIEKMIAELTYIENKCDSLKIGITKTFAYPAYYLDYNSLLALHEKKYLFARIGGSRVYDPNKDHPYLLPSWAMLSTNVAEIRNAIQQAKGGKIVILTIHGVPDYEHPWVTTTPEILKEHLQYLYDNHYKVISIKDLSYYINAKKAYRKIKPVIIPNK